MVKRTVILVVAGISSDNQIPWQEIFWQNAVEQKVVDRDGLNDLDYLKIWTKIGQWRIAQNGVGLINYSVVLEILGSLKDSISHQIFRIHLSILTALIANGIWSVTIFPEVSSFSSLFSRSFSFLWDYSYGFNYDSHYCELHVHLQFSVSSNIRVFIRCFLFPLISLY